MTARIETWIFAHRNWLLICFAMMTLLLLWSASHLRIDAGFTKLLPLEHPYMQTFTQYRQEFGGANRVVVALTTDKDDIFSPQFFAALKKATHELFFIPGVDRTQVSSLFTPNVRFVEIVEGGFAGGNVVPADFQPTTEGLEKVRQNIMKSGQMGRLVANDFSGAIVAASLLEIHPNTGERIDYVHVSHLLEEKLRQPIEAEFPGVHVHIIGFAKVIGDITDGAAGIIAFFALTIFLTILLVWLYSRSIALSMLPIGCSLVAVIWQLGLLTLFGYGIDPMSMLVPFLVFAIGVSHGVQMINAAKMSINTGDTNLEYAARNSFRRLLLPGSIALASDTIGFLTLLLIEIGIIQELAIAASIGVAVIILTNLLLLPLLLSTIRLKKNHQRMAQSAPTNIWRPLSSLAKRGPATIAIVIALMLAIAGLWKGSQMHIGDLHQGVPELHADSRYNKDTAMITDRFSIGVDLLSVIAEVPADSCIDHATMQALENFAWHIKNVEGVQSVITLASVARIINAGWNEGSLKWNVLPRDSRALAQDISSIDTSSGLLNNDCSVMPIHIFTEDHKATTIQHIVHAIEQFEISNPNIHLRLATGNVGVMAATNEAVKSAQTPMLLYVYAAITLLCLITFRCWRATLCIVLPLSLVSILSYALMALLDIGLKVSTLPVIALGVGIGVDYGIYIFSRLRYDLKHYHSLPAAYAETLKATGSAVVFTAITLAIGVMTWIFSDLKFQADMGLLLSFLFIVNMLASLLLLPTLAAWLFPEYREKTG
ncbi:MAG: MMPL family transporter [Mariprofundaceae bacterium]